MAATAPESLRTGLSALSFFAVFLALAGAIRADQSSEARDRISTVATALTAGNAEQAMTPFDRSYPEFDRLGSYFAGLAGAFQVQNEIDVEDEQDTAGETRVVVNWTLTLSNQATSEAERRNAEITVRVANINGKWKIVEFGPIAIFSPHQKPPAIQ